MLDCYTGPAPTRDVGICHGGMAQCLGDGSGYGPCLGEVTPQAENCFTPEEESCTLVPDCGAAVSLARFGNAAAQDFVTVAPALNGSIMILSTAAGSVDFGGGGLTSAGSSDVFVAEYAAGGTHLWSKRFGGIGADTAEAVAIDGTGNAFITGDFNGSVDFGGGPLISTGREDGFVLKLAPQRNVNP